jgi:hypothetical protein
MLDAQPFEAFNPTIAKRRNAEARVGKSGSFRRYLSILAQLRQAAGPVAAAIATSANLGRHSFLQGG